MELPDELFGQPSNDKQVYLQHAVIVHFIYYKDELDPLYELERKLEKVINEQGVGLYDGHEIAMDDSDGFLYMYGPSAENLFRAIKPILEETDFTRGALANLRFGAPGSEALEIDIEIER